MDIEEPKIDVDVKVDDNEKEAKRKAFAERIEGIVKKEKRSLVFRETLMSILSPLTSILAPWTGRSAGVLSAYAGVRQGVDYGRSLKGFQEESDYRFIGNKLFQEFGREVDSTMPEIEREVKKADELKDSIQKLSNEAVRFIRSKTQITGGLFGIGMSLFASTVPTLIKASTLGLGGVATSIGTIATITVSSAAVSMLSMLPIVQKRREQMEKFNREVIEAWRNSDRAKRSALANPALKSTTNSSEKMFQKLGNTLQNEMSVFRRGINFTKKIFGKVSLLSLGINAAVLSACYLTGMDIGTMATVFMSTNVLNNSIINILDAKARLKETSDSMFEHYRKFCHNKVYDLTYGKEMAPENTDTIQLKNICYHLRESDSKSPHLGFRTPQPLIQSEQTITFRPGINVLGGASGCGKTTLYKLLRHADDLSLGTISYGRIDQGKFHGVPITQMPRDEIYKHIAFSFQEIENDGQSGLDIIQQGNPYLDQKHIDTVAEMIGLRLYRETEAGIQPKPYNQLSGGEKKRVLFLQALLSPKRILVFDEPTSGVDEGTAEKMISLLDNDTVTIDGIPHKRTIIYTTHHAEELRKFKNIEQVVDMAPISDEKKIATFLHEFGVGSKALPTELTVYPFQTDEEKDAYIAMARSRDPSDKKEAMRRQQNAWLSLAIGSTIARLNQEKSNSETQEHIPSADKEMPSFLMEQLYGKKSDTK